MDGQSLRHRVLGVLVAVEELLAVGVAEVVVLSAGLRQDLEGKEGGGSVRSERAEETLKDGYVLGFWMLRICGLCLGYFQLPTSYLFVPLIKTNHVQAISTLTTNNINKKT